MVFCLNRICSIVFVGYLNSLLFLTCYQFYFLIVQFLVVKLIVLIFPTNLFNYFLSLNLPIFIFVLYRLWLWNCKHNVVSLTTGSFVLACFKIIFQPLLFALKINISSFSIQEKTWFMDLILCNLNQNQK